MEINYVQRKICRTKSFHPNHEWLMFPYCMCSLLVLNFVAIKPATRFNYNWSFRFVSSLLFFFTFIYVCNQLNSGEYAQPTNAPFNSISNPNLNDYYSSGCDERNGNGSQRHRRQTINRVRFTYYEELWILNSPKLAFGVLMLLRHTMDCVRSL